MKHSLIKYRFKSGSKDEWHQEIARFIAALDDDPALKGKIAYRVMKRRDGDEYYHLAAAADDAAVKALQANPVFRPYQEKTRAVGGGEVAVFGLEIIAETKFRA
jgi:quinol monooxygenase YgiN